ncbi:hypothetical protein HDU84_008077 [Entophlyctis sp. JEL0112]|nr:hypothetical protein HDU84_008077 [Entophlyctis sp. JEL0112]
MAAAASHRCADGGGVPCGEVRLRLLDQVFIIDLDVGQGSAGASGRGGLRQAPALPSRVPLALPGPAPSVPCAASAAMPTHSTIAHATVLGPPIPAPVDSALVTSNMSRRRFSFEHALIRSLGHSEYADGQGVLFDMGGATTFAVTPAIDLI